MSAEEAADLVGHVPDRVARVVEAGADQQQAGQGILAEDAVRIVDVRQRAIDGVGVLDHALADRGEVRVLDDRVEIGRAQRPDVVAQLTGVAGEEMDDEVAEPLADRSIKAQIDAGLQLVVVHRDLADGARDTRRVAAVDRIGELDEVRRRLDGDLRARRPEVGDGIAEQGRGGAGDRELAAQIQCRSFAQRVLHGAHAEDEEADLRTELGRRDRRPPGRAGEERVDRELVREQRLPPDRPGGHRRRHR